jgi:hypothetical protein
MSETPKTRKDLFIEAIEAIQKVGKFEPPLETTGTLRTLKKRIQPLVSDDLARDDELPGEVWRFLEKEYDFNRKELPTTGERAAAREEAATEAEEAVEGDGGKVGKGMNEEQKGEAQKKTPDLKKTPAKDGETPPASPKVHLTPTEGDRVKRLSRVESVVVALRKQAPSTFTELVDLADGYYADAGGNANTKESRWYSNLVVSSFVAAGYVTKKGDDLEVSLP